MNKKASYAFRILAGAYLIYLAYSLVKGYVVEREVSAGFLLVGVLFGALGLFFCVTGLLGRRQADREFRQAHDGLPVPEGSDGTSGEDKLKSLEEDGLEKRDTECKNIDNKDINAKE